MRASFLSMVNASSLHVGRSMPIHFQTVIVYVYFLYIYTYIHFYIYTYIHIHIYTYTHIYIYTYLHIYIYTFIHVYIFTYLHIYIYTYVHIYIYTYIHIYIYICTHVHIYICTFTYICMYIYIYYGVCVFIHYHSFGICFPWPPLQKSQLAWHHTSGRSSWTSAATAARTPSHGFSVLIKITSGTGGTSTEPLESMKWSERMRSKLFIYVKYATQQNT